MKADPYGAWAEQKRYKAGWLTASERKQKGINDSCGKCSGMDTNHGAHCKTLDLATRASAVCSKFIERTAEDI